MRENQHIISIPREVLEQLKTKANELNALLAPYAVALTAEERRELPKMGEKTVSFVQKAHELATANADLRPDYLDMAEFDTDMNDASSLLVVGNTTQQVLETVNDIEMLAGSEAYQAALAFYNYVKLLTTQDVPRARAIYEELKKRFPSRGKNKTNAENAAME